VWATTERTVVIDPSDFRAVGQAVKEVISWLTGYPCEVLRLDLELDADLGMDENKYEETWAIMHAMFPAAPQPTGSFSSIRDVARWFYTGPTADTNLPDQPPDPIPPTLPAETVPPVDPPTVGVIESDRGQAFDSGPLTDKLPPNPETLPSIPRGAITTRLPQQSG
jgi:hypothetical protein